MLSVILVILILDIYLGILYLVLNALISLMNGYLELRLESLLFSNIVSGNMYAFGNWAGLGSYMSIIITLILFTLIIKFVYKLNLMKLFIILLMDLKMVGTVFLVILTYAILVSTYNHSFISTIITWFLSLN